MVVSYFSIVEVKAYSHQGYPIRYELMKDSGANSNQFAIDGETGVVDLLQRLDYEKDPQQYHLKVRAIEIGRSLRSSTVNVSKFHLFLPLYPLDF